MIGCSPEIEHDFIHTETCTLPSGFFGDMAQMKGKKKSTVTLELPHHGKETKNFVLKKKDEGMFNVQLLYTSRPLGNKKNI